MSLRSTFRAVVVCLALVAVSCPQLLVAAQQAAGQSPGVIDVQLHRGNQGPVLIGQVVNQQGTPEAGVKVELLSGGRKVASTKTDRRGCFAFIGVQGGVYQLAAAKGQGTYRVWKPGTAPPTAQPGAVVVAGKDLVRGQLLPYQGAGLRALLTNPLVIAAVVATAVAVPVAIANADDDEAPASP